MRKIKHLVFLSFICLFLALNANAQIEETFKNEDSTTTTYTFRHAINMCPGGIAFGIYAVNYEYMINKNSGIVLRFDYESIPKTYSDAAIETSGIAFILNYRWRWSPDLKSEYLGAFLRYRLYQGSGIIEATNFDFTIPEFTIGLNIGKRWVWKSGFNINLALGYGYSFERKDIQPSNEAIESSIEVFENEYDFINSFLGEFSVGYAF